MQQRSAPTLTEPVPKPVFPPRNDTSPKSSRIFELVFEKNNFCKKQFYVSFLKIQNWKWMIVLAQNQLLLDQAHHL